MNYEWKVETAKTGAGLERILNDFERNMYRIMNILSLEDHIYVIARLDR